MEKHFEQHENNSGVLNLKFTTEEFSEAMNWAFKKNAHLFNIPGFRKGKAPMQIVLNYYGEGVLYDDAIDHLVNEAFLTAIREDELKPVSNPEMDINNVSLQEGLDVTLTFDTEPEVELGNYKGVEAVRPNENIDDKDVEDELKRVRERNARLIPVEDRGAQKGDTVNIDFTGYLDGKEFDGGHGEAYDLELGSGAFIPGFEEQLEGAKAEDDVEVNVTFPEDYNAENLAGQAANFKVKVNSVKAKELPELNDDFAMDVSEYDTLEEYKDSIKAELTKSAKDYADQEFENNVLKAVADNVKVDIPDSMIESELDYIYNYQDRQLRAQGIALEDYLNIIGESVEQFKDSIRPAAQDQVKMRLTIEAVIKAENIELSEADKDEVIAELAEQSGLEEDKIRERVSDNASYMQNKLYDKAVKFLVDNAKAISPSEAKVEEPEAAESEAAEPEVAETEAAEKTTAEDSES